MNRAESARDARIARLDDAALLSRLLDEDEVQGRHADGVR